MYKNTTENYLTKKLSGVSVAGGFFMVSKPLIDDLAHSSIKTLQFFIF